MRVNTRASFDTMTIAGGRVTPQMTLCEDETDEVPDLSTMTGQDVVMDVSTVQTTIFDVVPGREEA